MSKIKEVEIRILLRNRKVVESGIRNLGAKIIQSAKIEDSYYCPEEINNYKSASIDNTGYALRIRKLQNLKNSKKSYFLECKTLADKKNHALCYEYETSIEDPGNMDKILKSAGFKKFLTVEKKRKTYKFKKYNFAFEEIKGIGDGLEIEVFVENNCNKAYEELKKTALSLGITKDEILKKSLTYLAMKKLSKF